MSSFGIAVSGASVVSVVLQAALPGSLEARVTQALVDIPGGNTILSVALAGAGDGQTFTVTIEYAPSGEVASGGLTAAAVRCYAASQAEALAQARSQVTPPALQLVDLQVAGSSAGTRFMGLAVYGTVFSPGGSLSPVDTAVLASASRLADVDAAGLVDGTSLFVRSMRNPWTLRKPSSLTTDGITVIDALGGGQWVRDVRPDGLWTSQLSWTIDPITGNDENPGTALLPLRTYAELGRRALNAAQRLPNAVVTVTIASSLPVEDPINVNVWGNGSSFLLRFVGTPTLVQAGTLTGFTALVSGTNLPVVVDAAGLPASVLNRRLRMTNGAQSGAVAWPVREDAANTFTTFAFARTNKAAQPITGSPTLVSPSIGDAYAIEDLPRVMVQSVRVGNPAANGQFQSVVFDSLSIGDTVLQVSGFVTETMYVDSIVQLQSLQNGEVFLCNCLLKLGVQLANGTFAVRAGGQIAGSTLSVVGATLVAGTQFASMGAPLFWNGGGQGFIAVTSSVSAHGSPQQGTRVQEQLNMKMSNGALFWGSGNTGFGMEVNGNVSYLNTKPIVTGTAGDASVGGTARTWAQIPYIQATNDAQIVNRATP